MKSQKFKWYIWPLTVVLLIFIVNGCAQSPALKAIPPTAKGENLFTGAEHFYENGQFDQAADLYESYLSYEPDSYLSDNAVFRLGQIAMLRGNYILSLRLFEDLSRKYPGSELIPSARFQAARSLYLNYSWDKALNALMRFREDFPVSQYNPEVMLLSSDIYIKIREYAKAKETLHKLLEIYPDTPLKHSALFHLGLCEMYIGQTEEAINYLTISLKGELPDDERQDALYALGTLALMRGDTLAGVDYFSDLVKFVETGDRKGRVIKKVRDLIQKRLRDDEIKLVMERHPEDFPGDLAMIEMADRKYDQGDVSDARAYLEMFLAAFPDHPEAPSVRERLSPVSAKAAGPALGKFGCIAPLTGPLSGYGEKMIRGVKMAIEEYNLKYGTSLKVVLFDSVAKADNAQKGVELLAYEDRVSAIIGPLLTSTAMPAAAKAEQIGIPLFTPTATGEGLPETGKFVFRNCLTNRHQAEALASYAVEEMGLTRFGVLFPFNAYGQEMMTLFSDKINNLGAHVDIIEFYDQDDTDFKEQLIRVHQIEPEALFLPGSYEKIVLIAPQIPFYEPEEVDPNDPNAMLQEMASQLAEEDLEMDSEEMDVQVDEDEPEEDQVQEKEEILLLGTDGWYDQRLIVEGESYIENAVLSVGFFPGSREPNVKSFVSNFQRRYAEAPDLVSAQAYDATNMLLEASRGGEASWDETRKNLAEIREFPGVSGNTTLLPSGDSVKEVSLLQIKRRRFVPVERSLFSLNSRSDLWKQ